MTAISGSRSFSCALVLGLTASGVFAWEPGELDLREAVLRHMIQTYDQMEEQFDDPVGRRYCLAFDASLTSKGRAVPAEFLTRLSDHQQVRARKWCRWHRGRLLSVGPIEWSSPDEARVWSFSWVKSRPGGADCLRRVRRLADGWQVSDACEQGQIYD